MSAPSRSTYTASCPECGATTVAALIYPDSPEGDRHARHVVTEGRDGWLLARHASPDGYSPSEHQSGCETGVAVKAVVEAERGRKARLRAKRSVAA